MKSWNIVTVTPAFRKTTNIYSLSNTNTQSGNKPNRPWRKQQLILILSHSSSFLTHLSMFSSSFHPSLVLQNRHSSCDPNTCRIEDRSSKYLHNHRIQSQLLKLCLFEIFYIVSERRQLQQDRWREGSWWHLEGPDLINPSPTLAILSSLPLLLCSSLPEDKLGFRREAVHQFFKPAHGTRLSWEDQLMARPTNSYQVS